jgi:hypothetical protein
MRERRLRSVIPLGLMVVMLSCGSAGAAGSLSVRLLGGASTICREMFGDRAGHLSPSAGVGLDYAITENHHVLLSVTYRWGSTGWHEYYGEHDKRSLREILVSGGYEYQFRRLSGRIIPTAGADLLWWSHRQYLDWQYSSSRISDTVSGYASASGLGIAGAAGALVPISRSFSLIVRAQITYANEATCNGHFHRVYQRDGYIFEGENYVGLSGIGYRTAYDLHAGVAFKIR